MARSHSKTVLETITNFYLPKCLKVVYTKLLHSQNARAKPSQFLICKHSLLLHHVYNTRAPNKEWLVLNFNQNFNSREMNF